MKKSIKKITVKKNWKYFRTNCIAFFKFFFIGNRTIKKRLKNELQTLFESPIHTNLLKSGRSAVHAILLELKKQDYKDILIPYRLCNVVEVAAKYAEMNVFYYKDDADLVELLHNKAFLTDIPVLIVATYFNNKISKDDVTNIFLDKFGNDAPIIFDECQSLFDFSFFKKYQNYKRKFMVISFNDKFIPGVMGAAIISHNKHNISTQALSKKHELFYLAVLLKNCIDFIPRVKDSVIKGEFSACVGMRYDVIPFDIAKASCITALEFLKQKDNIHQHITSNHLFLNYNFNQNQKESKIYYLLSDKSYPLKKALKGPYLISENEDFTEAVNETGGIFIINSYKYSFL